MRVIVSTSGGKDSTFALYKAQQLGHEVVCLANTIANDSKRVRFHGIKAEIIQQQAKSLGIPVLQKVTTPESYRTEYIDNIRQAVKDEQVEGLVLGDIFLQDCFDWAEQICDELKIKLIEPLWQVDPEEIMKEFIDSGFEAVVVSTQASILDQSWVGRGLDESFLQNIKRLKGVDICGENGEYHTFVLNGPIFKKKLVIKRQQKVKIRDYWFLDFDV